MKPRAKTSAEVRKEFLDQVRQCVDYWMQEPRPRDVRERLDGLAFSILNIIDGTSGNLPSFDLVCRPHKDDKAYNKEQGENWYPDGAVINDTMLHDEYYEK